MILEVRRARVLAAVLIMLSGAACAGPEDPALDCSAPTLASGDDFVVGTSCIELITYAETTYYVGCAPIHKSRIGDPIVDDGGDTRFAGARAVRGLPPSKALLLQGGHPGECDRGDGLIAVSDAFTRFDAGLMRVRVGAPNEKRLARQRAPWIIPGRNEYPEALKFDAVLATNGITVTNRNRFRWRNCDQIQIGDQVNEIWETGDYLASLGPGASHTWPLDAFGRDHEGIEELSEDRRGEIEGEPFIIMCRAPRGRAIGRDDL